MVTSKELAAAAVQYAIGEIGVTEDAARTNKGEAKKYQDAVGLPKNEGYAWCMAFVYWCYMRACMQYKVSNPVVKTAGVMECYRLTPYLKKTVEQIRANPKLLAPGDQFIMKIGTAGLGHTGIIEKVVVNGANITLHTIEGNTNDEGSRDGYEVCRRQRKLTDANMHGFILYN